MKIIEKFLEKLLEKKHKTLIFSQFTMMLDVLECFLNFRDWSFKRLDGGTNIIDRQKILDEFNSKNSNYCIFLLSTRAVRLKLNKIKLNKIKLN